MSEKNKQKSEIEKIAQEQAKEIWGSWIEDSSTPTDAWVIDAVEDESSD